jgi:aerobic-type carbon monoxide dehydrogenase small subunit (CoxS/CutS family)
LRTECGLTGPKFGCGKGFCGACTVLVNFKPIRSCVFEIGFVKDTEVLTIEGLEENGALHPLQQAFLEHEALQCGFCTPGMILTAYSLLLEKPEPTREQIMDKLDQNLCRCSSYARIIPAVEAAAEMMKGGILR